MRVDQFLEDGVSEDAVDDWVQTDSILHSSPGRAGAPEGHSLRAAARAAA